MLSRPARFLSVRSLAYKPKASATPFIQTDIQEALPTQEVFIPVLKESRIPKAFRVPSVLAIFPLISGSMCCALCPHFELWLPALPNITHMTVIYAALHSSLYAGVHWGLAAALYDPTSTGVEAKRNRWQFVFSTLAPCFLWTSISSMMVMPYSHSRYLNNLCLVGFVYLATLFADTLYVRDYGLVPKWYRSYKVYLTVTALSCIFALAYGCYRFPEITVGLKDKRNTKSLSELVDKE